MAQLVLDIPDDQVDRVLDAFVERFFPADGSVPPLTNRAQKAAFAKQVVADHIKQIVWDTERRGRERAAVESITAPPTVDVS